MQEYFLVTGGAGFIGSHIIDYLLKKGEKVICVDNLSNGKYENIKYLITNKNFIFKKLDILDTNELEKVFKKYNIKAVCHQAAIGSVSRSLLMPQYYEENNVIGFINILDFSRKYNVSKIVFASSSSIYGNIEDTIKKEENVGSPLSPYALTKQTKEKYAEMYSSLYNLSIVGLRYFNVFGSRQNNEGAYAPVVSKFISKIEKGEAIEIFGDGKQRRDFTYIDNVVNANYLALTNTSNKLYSIYNVGCGESYSIEYVTKILFKLLGKKTEVKYLPTRKGDVKNSCASIEKIQKEINYHTLFTFNQGVEKLIDDKRRKNEH